MTFYMPTKVYEDKHCVATHGAELAALGTRAMLVTGKHSAKVCGAEADVTAVLKEHNIPYLIYNDVEENPSIETVMKARDAAVEFGADLFIGIGGGSPMDAAKAISLMAYQKDADAAYLFEVHPEAAWYPVVCIPTTCGTGSEVTGVSVLTLHKKKTKGSIPYKIFPELALLDAKYLVNMPTEVLHNTAVDALCHLVESYIHSAATPYSQMCALEGLHTWSRTQAFLLGDAPEEEPLEMLTLLLRASTFAGMAIAQTGTSLPHALSYNMTYSAGVPHGKACGQFLAGYVKEVGAADAKAVLDAAGFPSVDALSNFIEQVCGYEVLPEELVEHTVQQLAGNPGKLKNAPFPVDVALLERIAHFQTA